jgi:hypothetical protein
LGESAAHVGEAMQNTSLPYSLIYDLEEKQVVILAVMHEGREPNYWVERL